MIRCAALAMFCATPLLAQSHQNMSDVMCATVLPDPQSWGSDQNVRVDQDGWCSLKGMSGAFKVGEMRIRMPQADIASFGQRLPGKLSIRLDEITPGFNAQDAGAIVFLDLFDTVEQTFAASLDYQWDAETNQLVLSEAMLSEAGGNQFKISAVLDKIDLNTVSSTVSEAELVDFTLRSETDGSFNSAAVITTGALVVFGVGHRSTDELRAKSDLLRAIPDIPVRNLTPDDAAALTAFVDAWPYPSGAFEMKVESARGLTFSRLIAVIPDGFEDVPDLFGFFPDVTIKASWTPTP